MGYTAATLSRKGEDVSGLIIAMLRASGGPEAVSYRVASPEAAEDYIRLPEFTSNTGQALIACKNTYQVNLPQPLVQSSCALVFDGVLYDAEAPDSLETADRVEDGAPEGIETLVRESEGMFSVTAVEKGTITCGRDPVGTIPLYYGQGEEVQAVASNEKMLRAIGLSPEPVAPGTMLRLTVEGVESVEVRTIRQTPQHAHPEHLVVETLHRLLTDTAEAITRKVRGGALAFSGGIDSTLVAYYLSEAGADVQLICTGVGNRSEYVDAQAAADALGLELHVHPFTEEELEENLDEIIASVEDPDFMKIGVATPLYFAASKATESGHTVVFSGNGGDELFGGYRRYLTQWLEEGERVRETMLNDALGSWRTNFDRDAKICRDLGARLILPFTHPRIYEYALGIPTRLKLPDAQGKPRKVILRKLAKRLGMPAEVSDRPKKAAQYSTGAHRALQRIAKRHGMRPREFLEQRYSRLLRP